MANILNDLWEGATGKVQYRPGAYTATVDPNAARIEGLASQYLAAPSGAEAGAAAAAARANAAATSQAASARGANSALMLRDAMSQSGQVSRQIASDAAAAKTQELANRYGGAAQMYGKAGDLGMEAQGITARSYDNYNNLMLDRAKAEAEGKRGLYTGAMAAAGGLLAMSDVRGKEEIQPLFQESAPRVEPYEPRQPASSGSGGGLDIGSMMALGSMMSDENSKQEIERLRLENDSLLGTIREQRETAKGLPAGTSLKQLVDSYQARDVNRPKPVAPGPTLEQLAQAYEDQERAKQQPQFRADIGEAQIEDPSYQVDVGQAEIEDPRVAMLPSDERGKMSRRMYSDERGKDGLRELLQMATQPAANRENLGEIDGFSYRYKPEMAEAIGEDTGRRVGVMAQDVEQAPAGAQVVEETENGKALDVNRALGFSLAGIAGLDKRLALLEEATGKRRKVA